MTETCRVCQKPMHPYPMGEKDGYTLISCKVCGSVMVDPPVTDQEREEFFGEIQPQITHVPNPIGEIENLKKTIRKIAPDLTGRRFLDIGCRNGYAVMAAKGLGLADAKGIDAHDFFIRFAQEKYGPAAFTNVRAQDYADGQKKADILFARSVFGEQTDLEGFTAAASSLLAPGGVFYIEEPDGNGFNTPRSFASWNIVQPPINFTYLSKQGLSALLERHGLAVQKFLFSWKPMIKVVVTRR